MERQYDARLNGERGYYAARRLQREALLLAGLTEPIDDTERAIVAQAREERMKEGCRYIEGDPIPTEGQSHDDLYCNAPKKPGSAYCDEHHKLCWVPHTKSRKALLDPGQWDKRGRDAA